MITGQCIGPKLVFGQPNGWLKMINSVHMHIFPQTFSLHYTVNWPSIKFRAFTSADI